MRFRFSCNYPYGGKIREAGSVHDLSPLAVKNLTAHGAGEAAPEEKPAPNMTIAEAIDQLDVDDASLWLTDGRPRVDAIERVLGRQITEQDRDDAVRAVLAAHHEDVATPPAPVAVAATAVDTRDPEPAREGARPRQNRKRK